MIEIFQELFLLGAVFAYFFKDSFVGWCMLIVSLSMKLGMEGLNDWFNEGNDKLIVWVVMCAILVWMAEQIAWIINLNNLT